MPEGSVQEVTQGVEGVVVKVSGAVFRRSVYGVPEGAGLDGWFMGCQREPVLKGGFWRVRGSRFRRSGYGVPEGSVQESVQGSVQGVG